MGTKGRDARPLLLRRDARQQLRRDESPASRDGGSQRHELRVVTDEGMLLDVGEMREADWDRAPRDSGEHGALFAPQRACRERWESAFATASPTCRGASRGTTSISSCLNPAGAATWRAHWSAKGTCVTILDATIELVDEYTELGCAHARRTPLGSLIDGRASRALPRICLPCRKPQTSDVPIQRVLVATRKASAAAPATLGDCARALSSQVGSRVRARADIAPRHAARCSRSGFWVLRHGRFLRFRGAEVRYFNGVR